MLRNCFEDKHGNLWIGSNDGISRYNPDLNNFTRFATKNGRVDPLDPNTNRRRQIVEDSDGRLWVASQRSGLFYFDERTQSFVPHAAEAVGTGLGTTHATAICQKKWISLGGNFSDGLKKIDTKPIR